MEDGNLPESTLNPIRNKMRRVHHLLRILHSRFGLVVQMQQGLSLTQGENP